MANSPIVVLADAPNQAGAKGFVAYVRSEAGKAGLVAVACMIGTRCAEPVA